MKNLQLCVPYQKCPFACPMCIAEDRNDFRNFYKDSKDFYLAKLERFIYDTEGTYKDYIITGATEPTLNSHWLEDVLILLNGSNVELQTKNYNLHNFDLTGVKTLSYSITKASELSKAWKFRKLEKGNTRLVILLSKEFDYLTLDRFATMGFNQITFKVLQYSESEQVNRWIEKNKMTDFTEIEKIVNHYNGSNISVRIDRNCQDSQGRYDIFREDGRLYSSWEEKRKV